MENLAINEDAGGISIARNQGNEENPPSKIQGDEVATQKKIGQIIQKNYVLNDANALKKKKRHESRKEAYNLGTEARDGSNMVIQMKTSFFEHVKAGFIHDLVSMEGIEQIDNAIGAKVSTESSGEAFVEYSLDIKFTAQEKTHVVKITAYTTSCRMVFQPVGEPAQTKILSGSKSIPRFFVDTFFLPWCEKAYANKTYDEKEIIDAINIEIKRLELIKLAKKAGTGRGRLSSALSTSEIRCVARECKYTGINSNNKSAVGVCAKCGSLEHFECSKTKPEDREDILKGNLKYFCSICFIQNPSMIAFDANKFLKVSNPSKSSGVLQITSTAKATPIPHPVDPVVKYGCKICIFESETPEELGVHNKKHHTIECEICKKTFDTKPEKEAHVLKDHTPVVYKCITCDSVFNKDGLYHRYSMMLLYQGIV